MISTFDYSKALQTWIPAARKQLYRLPNVPQYLCYGPGNHSHWAMQANTTALSAFAVLATDPASDTVITGMSRDELLDTALAMLRFTLQSHKSGSSKCTDGEQWGFSWISALCIERMMHAIEALEPHLTDSDQAALKRVLLSESDWLLDEYEIVAGTVENNKPESNMWNGSLLCRTVLFYPDTPRAEDYLEKGITFLINAISVPSDAECAALIDRKSVRDRHVGANFFSSYACNHHGYLNIGYMVITLSNAAMLHFAYRHRNRNAPEALYRNVAQLWQLVKTCTFPDGRLLRIGGDTRVRYCYCQDYAIPVWLMIRDKFGDSDAEKFEEKWLQQVQKEAKESPDGAFLGERLAQMAKFAPLYYARLEGDRAGAISMGAYWRRRYNDFHELPVSNDPVVALSQWHDEYHGAAFVRDPERIASWVWRAAEPPQGLCLPPTGSSMAEWRNNLAGRVSGMGMITDMRLITHNEQIYDGAFATCGRIVLRDEQPSAEGDVPADIAVEDIAFAALPDRQTVIGIQRVRSIKHSALSEIKGMLLQIPNDLYNDRERNYCGPNIRINASAIDGDCRVWDCGPWLNVDSCLSVLSLDSNLSLKLYRPDHRQVTIRGGSWYLRAKYGDGFLAADEVCLGACTNQLVWTEPDDVLFDISFALRTGLSVSDTSKWAAEKTVKAKVVAPANSADIRLASVSGADGFIYTLIANFADKGEQVEVKMEDVVAAFDLHAKQSISLESGILKMQIAPHTANLLRLTGHRDY